MKEASEIIKKVRKIEIKTKGLSNQIFAGEYQSAFKGRGMTFSEIREYGYGDDIRTIDWNVTARYHSPFVKVFSEERELTLMLLVDISPSIFYGVTKTSKNEYITELCAVLAFAAIQNNDKVGLILFSDKIEKFVPPKKGRTHILRIIRELVNIELSVGKTDLHLALSYFNNVMKKRSICFLVSDFITPDDYNTPLSIAARRHDLIGIQVCDKTDKALPDVGLIRAYDAEVGSVAWLDTSHKPTRDSFATYYKRCEKTYLETFKKSGSDSMQMITTDNYVKTLIDFFNKRGHKK